MQYRDLNTEKLISAFGGVVKEKREFLNKSQTLLSYEYGLDSGNLCRIESGKIEPKLTMMQRIAEALNIPLSELIKEVENRLGSNFSIIKQ